MQSKVICVTEALGGEAIGTIRELRYRVLREPLHLPFADTLFEGDEAPTTRHVLAHASGKPIGCLTLLVPAVPALPSNTTTPLRVQLRGMAVLAEYQGEGVGSQLLRYVHRLAIQHRWLLWCNARANAVPFYSRNGWRVEGDPFDIPVIGPHFKMHWEVPS